MKAWVLALALCATAMGQETRRVAGPPRPGDGRMEFVQAGRRIPLWYHRTPGTGPDLPVVFVLHGALRDAENYLHDWDALADRYHFLLVVPEFSAAEFPGDIGYILGNTV